MKYQSLHVKECLVQRSYSCEKGLIYVFKEDEEEKRVLLKWCCNLPVRGFFLFLISLIKDACKSVLFLNDKYMINIF